MVEHTFFGCAPASEIWNKVEDIWGKSEKFMS